MKTTAQITLALAMLALSGCATNFRLPNVEGESVSYTRTDPLGGTHIEATNVKVTDTEVTAETANFAVTYPSFNVKLTVKGYKRQRTASDKAVQ